MVATTMAPDRQFHWLKPNHATRSPHRWTVMDSETHAEKAWYGEVQTFRLAVVRRWHDERGKVAGMATQVCDDPESVWEFITQWCRKGATTVLWCHNLDFDLQVTRAFEILPQLGWRMVWCNLDQQVSMAKWTRDGATLKMADTNAWVAKPLATVGAMLGVGKPDLPAEDESREAWERRCVADVEITTCLVMALIDYIRDNQLGNMQFSGAGMGYAMWRHKYLDHQVLVHANEGAILAERAAMHTGRAEAWRHGTYTGEPLYEWDLTNAYTIIARDCNLPRQLLKEDSDPTPGRYSRWADKWALLAKVEITTELPCVPAQEDGRIVWPVGTFTTWLWDCEIEMARKEGAAITLLHVYAYYRGPIMKRWAEHTLDVLHGDHPEIHDVVKLWYKQQARSVIGRCGVKYTCWENSGPDHIGMTGLSTASRDGGETTFRLLHVGGELWEETGQQEGRDSMPMIPSWIAAQCRVRLWRAMSVATLEDVYYVDTDSLIVNEDGHTRMLGFAHLHPELGWRVKGTYRRAEIHGPRQIVLEREQRISGVPKKAQRTGPARFEGEVWQRAAAGLAGGRLGEVRVSERKWHINWTDRRRRQLADGTTEPLRLESSRCEPAPDSAARAGGPHGVT